MNKSNNIKSRLTGIAGLTLLAITALSELSPQDAYIEKWAPIAVSEMYRSGVPASITLAQGLLESRAGLSELATVGNNHFGIKCHDWKGRTIKVDDEKKGECFRAYDDATDSFRDHSDFLRYRDRYRKLFDNDVTDYKAWAHGLSRTGYATDLHYGDKLIELIERYRLYRFDSPSVDGTVPDATETAARQEPQTSPDTVDPDVDRSNARFRTKARTRRRRFPKSTLQQEVPVQDAAAAEEPGPAPAPAPRHKEGGTPATAGSRSIPPPPSVLEEPVLWKNEPDETVRFSTGRKVYSVNGVPFLYSCPGDSYASIAEENSLFLAEILKFNDLSVDRKIPSGTKVFIAAKKKQAAKGLDKYIVESDGEQMRDIAQRFGIRLSSLRKMNGFASDHLLYEGDTVKLREEQRR